jgi:hypothetical protein
MAFLFADWLQDFGGKEDALSAWGLKKKSKSVFAKPECSIGTHECKCCDRLIS